MTAKQFRPMLAATIESEADLEKLRYPLIASPKVDGIRCVVLSQLGPVTRSLKSIPNHYIRGELIAEGCYGFDGELVVGDITAPDVFNLTTSAVMSRHGTPPFTYWVFDCDVVANPAPYEDRIKGITEFGPIKRLPFSIVETSKQVLGWEAYWLEAGYEGIMLRDPKATYKWGRSTFREQGLLKFKRMADGEAEIIGFEPLERNQNESAYDLLGLSKRSNHQAGKVVDSTLGRLRVRHIAGRSHDFGEFAIGTGFDVALRQSIWDNQADWLGKIVSFKYQSVGIVDKPRFPSFKGVRKD